MGFVLKNPAKKMEKGRGGKKKKTTGERQNICGSGNGLKSLDETRVTTGRGLGLIPLVHRPRYSG